jgi:hypothetical protein
MYTSEKSNGRRGRRKKKNTGRLANNWELSTTRGKEINLFDKQINAFI